ncbi:MAG TPA: ribosome biogenesis factor YjgA [Gammaproteobacteria bacterium]
MPDTDRAPKSRSQKKREHHALQALAESLIRLSAGQLAAVSMSDALRQNVMDASAMKKGALRRQIRFLARLLSEEDSEAVFAAVERATHGSREETARLHRIERWRERLVENDATALAAFVEAYPDADRQQVRNLARAARRERERKAPPKAFRRLFALIRELES